MLLELSMTSHCVSQSDNLTCDWLMGPAGGGGSMEQLLDIWAGQSGHFLKVRLRQNQNLPNRFQMSWGGGGGETRYYGNDTTTVTHGDAQ